MKKSRFSESRIVGILNEVELSAKVGETFRKHGISDADPLRADNPLQQHDSNTAVATAGTDRRERQAQMHVFTLGAHAPHLEGCC